MYENDIRNMIYNLKKRMEIEGYTNKQQQDLLYDLRKQIMIKDINLKIANSIPSSPLQRAESFTRYMQEHKDSLIIVSQKRKELEMKKRYKSFF